MWHRTWTSEAGGLAGGARWAPTEAVQVCEHPEMCLCVYLSTDLQPLAFSCVQSSTESLRVSAAGVRLSFAFY